MRHHTVARRLAFGVLLLGAAHALPAWAEVPAVDEVGAKAMAAAIKDGLAQRFPAPTEDDGGTIWEWDGAPKVTPAGDHYEVALPSLTVEDGEGHRFDVGTIRLSVAPRDGGAYAVAATFPDRIPVMEQDDEGEDYRETGAITIGRQRFSGLWSGAYQTLVTLDGAFGDLAATNADGKGSVAIGAVTLMQELKPDDAAGTGPTWSGPGAFAFSNIAVRDERKRDVLTLGGLTVETQSLRVDMARSAQLQQVVQRFNAAATPQAAGLVEALHGIAAGGSSRMRLSDLSLRDPKDGTRVAFSQFTFSSGADGLDKDQSTVTLGVEARGLSVTPAPAPEGFLPRNFDLQLSLGKLPNGALSQALIDLAAVLDAQKAEGEGEEGAVLKGKPGAKGKGKTAEDPIAPIVQRVSAAIAQAGAELRIEKLELDSPLAAASAIGNARYVPDSAMGAVGGATVKLRGLDAVVKTLQPAPGKKADKDTQQTLGVLTLLQAMGQLSKDEAGTDVRTYQIDVTDAGQMTLNGADLMPLLAGASGGAPEETPAPKKKKN